MPFDGMPTEIKPGVFSLDGLIAWLERQPGEAEYSFWSCWGNCLLDRYLAASFARRPTAKETDEIHALHGWKVGSLACAKPRTHAAALSRARALLTCPQNVRGIG